MTHDTSSADEARPSEPAPRGLLDRLAYWAAMAGGLLAVALAMLVVASVLSRWLFNRPIEGDFEFAQHATALAVFAYLPLTHLQRSNIMVDTFTMHLRPRTRQWMDAFWDVVLALIMGIFTAGLGVSALEAAANHEATMQLQVLIWPAIAVSAVLSGLLVAVALAMAVRALRGRP